MIRKYCVNENYFDELTQESAYWLGFIQADGSVNGLGELSIEINKKDKHLLEMFKACMQSSHPIRNTKNGCVRLRIFSKKLCDRLNQLGIMPNKSHLNTFPIITDDRLFKHFLRGVFDGDGCVTIRYRKNRPNGAPKVSIVGGKDFCEYALKETQRIAGIDVGGVYKSTSIYSMEFSGFKTVSQFFDWLYLDSEIYLDRKFTRFKEVLTKRIS